MRGVRGILFALLWAGGSARVCAELPVVNDLQQIIEKAGKTEKPIYLLFSKLEDVLSRDREATLADKQLAKLLQSRFVAAMVDPSESPALARKYGGTSPPVSVILLPDGELFVFRSGHYGPEEMIGVLEEAESNIRKLLTGKKQIAKEPEKPEGYVALGEVYAWKKDWAKVKEYFSRVLELDPEYKQPFAVDVAYWLLRAHKDTGNRKEADYYDVVLGELDPKDAKGYRQQLRILDIREVMAAANWEDAIGPLEQFLEDFPKSSHRPDVLMRLGYSKKMTGQTDEALEIWERTKREHPEGPWIEQLDSWIRWAKSSAGE